jgi:DNA-binding IclR family transcriptional regulator
VAPVVQNDSQRGAKSVATSPSRTLEKGLQVLGLFDVEHPEWTLKEIRERAGLPKATSFRLVKTLENQKYLTYDPDKGTYHLGSNMLRAAYLALSHSELVRMSRPFVRRLAETTTETVDLSVWTDQGAMIVDTVYTSRPFRPNNPPGMVMKGLANVHSKLYVALGPESAWPQVIAESSVPRTQHTITEPEELMNELQKVRREGVAFGLQEHNLGMCAVGAPVFGVNSEVRAVLAVVVPSERFGPPEMRDYAAAVTRVGRELSRELGYPEGAPSAHP